MPQIPPPNDRPTAQELARIGGAQGPAVCPYCGATLFAYRTETLKTRIIRYERCHNPECERKFKTRQEHRIIVEEIKPPPKPDVSSSGNGALNIGFAFT